MKIELKKFFPFQNMSSNLDPKLVYHPPISLQFPEGMEPKPKVESRPDSPNSSSSSRSDLSSPSFNRDSEFEFPGKVKSETVVLRDEAAGSFENESDSNSTTTPKTIMSEQNVSKESLVGAADMEKRRLQQKTPVSLKKNSEYGR